MGVVEGAVILVDGVSIIGNQLGIGLVRCSYVVRVVIK